MPEFVLFLLGIACGWYAAGWFVDAWYWACRKDEERKKP